MRRRSVILWLALGVVCLLAVRVTDSGLVWCVSSFLWPVAFLHLTINAASRRELLGIGCGFTAAYILRFWGAMGLPVLDVFLIGLISAAGFGCFLLYRRLTCWRDSLPATLIFPISWVALCDVFMLLRFPAVLRIDHWFYDCTPLVQSAALVGTTGLSAMILWAASLVSWSLRKKKLHGVGIAAGLAAALLLFGGLRLAGAQTPAQTLRVAYTTGPYVGDFMNFQPLTYERAEASVIQAAEAAAAQNAAVLVFNEEAFELPEAEADRLVRRLRTLAEEKQLYVLVGLDVDKGEAGRDNCLVWIDPTGERRGSYSKHNLIPLLEAEYTPGEGGLTAYPVRVGGETCNVSFAICYDSNFPGYLLRMPSETDVLFLPSWDWAAVTRPHSRICGMIAAECGVAMLKPTYDGRTIAADAFGRQLFCTDTAVTGFETVQLAELPVGHVNTPARVFGRVLNRLDHLFAEKITEREEKKDMLYALIGMEVIAIIIDAVLLYASCFEFRTRSKRRTNFILLVSSNLLANLVDLLSWELDGIMSVQPLLFAVTLLSLLGSYLVYVFFYQYVFTMVSERHPRNPKLHLYPMWAYLAIVGIWTVVASFTGGIFTLTDGFYAAGPQYDLYLILNAVLMIYVVVDILACAKYFSLHDFVALFSYLLLPFLAMLLNFVVPEYSFVFPVMAVALLIMYVMLQSHTEQHLINQELATSFVANHDSLTGLQNRRAFSLQYGNLQSAEPVGVIFCDVNGLKYTNDHFGHQAGDELLCSFTELLLACYPKDAVFRMSGDEFLVALDGSEQSFSAQAQRLREQLQAMEEPIACMGSAYGPRNDFNALMIQAENEMYAQKQLHHARFPEHSRITK